MRSTTTAVVIVIAVAAAAAMGWMAGQRITTPADEAARRAVPSASPILVPVEERTLTVRVVTRGTARFGSPQKLTIATSALKTNAGHVSEIVTPGAVLHEGDVLLRASGRPVFLLAGVRPTSRDLGPGMSGDDVRQLEAALARLSFDPGPIDGNYDARTEAAVAAWYARAGAAPFTATVEQLATVRSRELDAAAARADLLSANAAVAAAALASVTARAALDEANARVARGAAAISRARRQSELAERAARAELDASQAALDAVRAATDPPPSATDLALAARDVVRAQAAFDLARLNGEREVGDAEAAHEQAGRDVTVQFAALRTADENLDDAKQSYEERRALRGLAEQEVDLARRSSGIQVPADEVIFLPDPAVRVSEAFLSKGDTAAGAALVVTDSVVSIDGALALKDRPLVSTGAAVIVEEPDLGIAATGVIRRIAESPGTNGVDGFHLYFETGIATPPANLAGASVRLTIAVQSSQTPVIAVPVSALTLAPDGSSRVQRAPKGATPDVPLEFVTVVPGLVADGYVAVRGDLSKGDLVMIGTNRVEGG